MITENFENFNSNFLAELKPQTIEDYPLKLLKAGYSVIPLGQFEKKPKLITGLFTYRQKWQDWQSKQISRQTLKRRIANGANVGIIPAYNALTVIDLDTKNMNSEALEAANHWLKINEQWIRKTPIHSTPNNGFHFFVISDIQSDGDFYLQNPNNRKWYQAGELRTYCYVVAPPSIVPNDSNGELTEYQVLQSCLDFEPQKVCLDDIRISLHEGGIKTKTEKHSLFDVTLPDNEPVKEMEMEPEEPKPNDKQWIIHHPDKAKEIFDVVISNSVKAISESFWPNRYKIFRDEVYKCAGIYSGFLKRGIKLDRSKLDQLLEIGLLINDTNENMDTNNVFQSCLTKGIDNPYHIIFNNNIYHTPHPYESLYTHFRTNDDLFNGLETRRKDSTRNRKAVMCAVFNCLPPLADYNGIGRYYAEGFNRQWLRSVSENQQSEIVGIRQQSVNRIIKQLEGEGRFLRLHSDHKYHSCIYQIGDDTRGYYVSNPLPENERSMFHAISEAEQRKIDEERIMAEIRETVEYQNRLIMFKRPEPVPEYDY